VLARVCRVLTVEDAPVLIQEAPPVRTQPEGDRVEFVLHTGEAPEATTTDGLLIARLEAEADEARGCVCGFCRS
jgi:hypothetical protein